MSDTASTMFDYHHGTSHTRGVLPPRGLNPKEQPVPFKLYKNLPPFHLPQGFTLPDVALDKALDRRPFEAASMTELLAGVCNLATGITMVKKHTRGTVFHFRATPSAGALYPTELYLAIQNINGLNDGLYHYSPLEHTLTPLRTGLIFSALAGSEPIIRFYLTSIFHRSSWKYGDRAYRYCLLDTGHVMENLMTSCRIHGLRALPDYDFDDKAVNRFLCVDPAMEGCLTQIHALGCSPETAVYDSVPPRNESLPGFSRCSPNPHLPPNLVEAHRLTSTPGRPSEFNAIPPTQDATPLPDPVVQASASTTIQHRRSRRNFIATPAPTRDLVDILGLLCQKTGKSRTSTIQAGFLAAETSGLTPGYHHLDLTTCSTALIKEGSFMARSARICLDQGWLENAAMHMVFTADLTEIEARFGPRGYRYAHMEAGRLGQRAYLAATAKKLGACGIGAFFDQEACALLDLPDGHALLYLVAIGPVRL